MCINFLELLRHLSPFRIGYEVKKFEYSFVLDKKNFPDCMDKEFKYGKRLWNPFGKTGLAHHSRNGWDWLLPEDKETES